ncbi:hypothetical protein GGF43_002960, partial [Coemansia sp. RSA 2618]
STLTLRDNGHHLGTKTSVTKLNKVKSQVIDNECSMARDQFAAERNFLAWFKLAMSVVSSATIIFRDFKQQS